MEELQDAIEDAQYMNAMHDDLPRPTKDWKFPTPDEMSAYFERMRAEAPKGLELEGVCDGALGYYMFLSYCKAEGSEKYVHFMLDVATFRVSLANNTS